LSNIQPGEFKNLTVRGKDNATGKVDSSLPFSQNAFSHAVLPYPVDRIHPFATRMTSPHLLGHAFVVRAGG
ncbi:MAG: hypothetical protein VX470_06465, partial [Planctomycetota bacterium]|nr:hypothetical protein [Planctomycetota bacterium]